jgi:hypothetical protein
MRGQLEMVKNGKSEETAKILKPLTWVDLMGILSIAIILLGVLLRLRTC